MKLLWTKSNKIGSKLIRWGTNSESSHFCVLFDDKPGGYGIVFHSQFTGVNIKWFGEFQRSNTIVKCLSPKLKINEEALYQILVSNYYGKPYDNLAFLYWTLSVLAHKVFGTDFPTHNQWGDREAFLCTEIGQDLFQLANLKVNKGKDFGMITPDDLFTFFEESDLWQSDYSYSQAS